MTDGSTDDNRLQFNTEVAAGIQLSEIVVKLQLSFTAHNWNATTGCRSPLIGLTERRENESSLKNIASLGRSHFKQVLEGQLLLKNFTKPHTGVWCCESVPNDPSWHKHGEVFQWGTAATTAEMLQDTLISVMGGESLWNNSDQSAKVQGLALVKLGGLDRRNNFAHPHEGFERASKV